MNQKVERRYGAILLEMFSIVVAVVLGFAVTRWNDDQRDRERAAAAVARITHELETNHAALVAVIPYYRDLNATIDSLLRTDGDSTFRGTSIPGWRGLRPPRLRSASFTVATSAGAFEHVAADQADMIAAAYEMVEGVETATDQLMGAVVNGNVRELSSLSLGLTVLREFAEGAEHAIAEALRGSGPIDP